MTDKQGCLSDKDIQRIDSMDWVKVPGWLSQGCVAECIDYHGFDSVTKYRAASAAFSFF